MSVLIFFLWVTRHAARAGLFTGLVMPAVFWLAGQRGMLTWVSIPVGLVIAARFIEDWKRTYRELWLDREKQG